MVQLAKVLAVAAACLAAPVVAHPGEKHDPHVLKRELHVRDAMAAAGKRSLGGCESTLHARELAKRNVARRAHTVQNLRQKRGITSGKTCLQIPIQLGDQLANIPQHPRSIVAT